MTDEAGRRYTEDEVALILRRAAELDVHSGGGRELTLAEVQDIAREAGIPPEQVVRAARTVERPHADAFAPILGAPTTFARNAEVPGMVPEASYPELVQIIRDAFERHGRSGHALSGMEWKAADGFGGFAVSIRPTTDGTKVQVRVRRADAATVTYLLSGIGWLVITSLLGDVLNPATAAEYLLLIGGGTVSAYATARAVWSRLMGSWQDRVDRLLDRLTEAIGRSAPRPGAKPGDLNPPRASE